MAFCFEYSLLILNYLIFWKRNLNLKSLTALGSIKFVKKDLKHFVQKVRFILSTGQMFNMLQQAVHYTYRQYEAKRNSTPNEQSPCREA